jgi:ERF superfamily
MPKEKVEQIERVENRIAVMDPQSLIASAIEKGATIETLERLVSLAKEVRAEQAKSAYYEAMAEFQRRCPPIPKTGKARIRTRGGSEFEYSFAPLEVITQLITPIMGPLGLSISYRISQDSSSVTAACLITHELGHTEESGPITMPIEKTVEGGSGANPAQRVGIAMSYAKRYALLAKTGIAPQGEDLDGSPAKEKPKVRPIVKAEVVEDQRQAQEEEFNLQPEEQPTDENLIRCQVTGVLPRSDSKKRLYMLVETDAGPFYCWDEKRFKEIALTEGQPVRIKFDPHVSGEKTYRYIKTIEVVVPKDE